MSNKFTSQFYNEKVRSDVIEFVKNKNSGFNIDKKPLANQVGFYLPDHELRAAEIMKLFTEFYISHNVFIVAKDTQCVNKHIASFPGILRTNSICSYENFNIEKVDFSTGKETLFLLDGVRPREFITLTESKSVENFFKVISLFS